LWLPGCAGTPGFVREGVAVDFGVTPDKTVALRLVANSRSPFEGYRARQCIDLTEFPSDRCGVYVMRFVERVFPRPRGESSVLKVGECGVPFRARFGSYNGKKEATTFPGGLAELTRWCTNAKTEFQFMWMLPRLLELGPVVLDLYYTTETKALQGRFLLQCLDTYWDMPPLNRGLS
jgi:hypothetical protein